MNKSILSELVVTMRAILEQQKKTNVLLAAILSTDQDEQSYTGTMDDDGYDQDDSETL